MRIVSKAAIEANLRKYQLLVLLQKRAYLPVLGIYLVSAGKLSLIDIATISSITVFLRLLIEIPTGHFADRFGRKRSVVLGSFFIALSPLLYVVLPSYAGALSAAVLFFCGMAFVSGAHSAFLHDTMEALGRESEYAQFRGRVQSYSLIGNMVIVALVPMTYTIDPRLPFVIGSLILFAAFFIALSYEEPPLQKKEQDQTSGVIAMFKKIPKTELIFLFSVYGIVSSVFDNAPQFREILFTQMDIPVIYFGAILGFGSLLAAVMGHTIHRLAHLSHHTFYFFDIFMMVVTLIMIGATENPYMAILGFSILVMYDRNRSIVAEAHILSRYRAIENKAVLLSLRSFFSSLHGLWVSLLMGACLHFFGISKGFVFLGIGLGAFSIVLMYVYFGLEKRKVDGRVFFAWA